MREGLVPPLIAVEARRAARVPVRAEGGTAAWRIEDERDGVREGREAVAADGTLELPPLTPGYHRITVSIGERSASAWIDADFARPR